MIICWSVKGGSGTTVVASSLASVLSRARPTWLVDLAGDTPAALGVPEPASPGVADWLASPTADGSSLARLVVSARDTLGVLPRGSHDVRCDDTHRWEALAVALSGADAEVVVDAGVGEPPNGLARHARSSLLVTRSCYLSLRRAVGLRHPPTGVVLLVESGRALGVADVEHAVGAPVVAQVHYDPAVARAVDAGLLRSRLPHSLEHPLRRVRLQCVA